MNKRWDKQEEKFLISNLKGGKNINQIAQELNRSSNAVTLRLQKIIYDNISGGKSIDLLQKHLSLDKDTVSRHYHAYKILLEKKKESLNKQLNINTNQTSQIKEAIQNTTKLQTGGKLDRIIKQNNIMKEILANFTLKNKIKNLIKHKKISKKVLNKIKDI